MIAITTVSERMMINTKNKLDQYSLFEKGFFINKNFGFWILGCKNI